MESCGFKHPPMVMAFVFTDLTYWCAVACSAISVPRLTELKQNTIKYLRHSFLKILPRLFRYFFYFKYSVVLRVRAVRKQEQKMYFHSQARCNRKIDLATSCESACFSLPFLLRWKTPSVTVRCVTYKIPHNSTIINHYKTLTRNVTWTSTTLRYENVR
jgi:hypothetical protein